MPFRSRLALSLLLGLFLSAFLPLLHAQTGLTDLQTEYLPQPLAVETTTPRFRWRMTTVANRQNAHQTAYQITVTDEKGEPVWDSGKVTAETALNIPYAGTPLQPRTRYDWSVTIWAEDGSTATGASRFETALTLGGRSQTHWNDAQWIGGGAEDLVLYSPYLSVFRIDYTLTLAPDSDRAAFLFGGNDPRLLDKNKNLLAVENARDESYLALVLDVTGLDEGQPAQLQVYRVGYAPTDRADRPLRSYPIPDSLINTGNRYAAHRFTLELVFGQGNIYLDGSGPEHRLNPEPMNLNPYGNGGDFISAPMVADVGYLVEAGEAAGFSEVAIRNYRQPGNVLATLPDTQFITQPHRQLRLADPSRHAAPLLRTEFTTADRPIARARLYVTARGIYEVYLNGERVGVDYFDPGLTQYNKTHFYQTYDVTDQLRAGGNALGAWLSEGWWSGNITFKGENWNYFGDRQSLLAQLIVTYADGSEQVITSNDRDWKLFTDGPLRYGSFFQGEVYDARREAAISGWAEPGFDDTAWQPARRVPLDGTAVTGSFTDLIGRPGSLAYDDWNLRSQLGRPVTAVDTLTARSVGEVRPGVYLYDMGQNMVGVPQITLDSPPPGDTITLRFAEVLYPPLDAYAGKENTLMLENFRAALVQDIYVTKGAAREVIQPRFTFHGYRYVELTGTRGARPLDAVKGVVLSSVQELASSYETSNPLVNQLWRNITWSLRGNFLSIPTDTPARNERMGWNGDINVFSRAATWLADINLFLNRHALALRDMQSEDGRFSDVAPVGNGFGGTIWGSAGVIVPWENYRHFGDLAALRAHFPAMQRYVSFLGTRFEDGLLMEGPLGDWLSPENDRNDNSLLWAAYYGYDLDILGQTARALGENDLAADYEGQYAQFRRQFAARYLDPASGYTLDQGLRFNFSTGVTIDTSLRGKPMDTQASYAVPLALGMVDSVHHTRPDWVGTRLAATVERENTDDSGTPRPPYSLMTGFIGTAAISEALSATGRDDLAYRLLQQETYPSWLYPVKNGATTIWERLNSYTEGEGFGGNNSMNSFNHYSFGAVAAWMYERSLGIQRDSTAPGFKRFILAPTPDPTGEMTFARGHYNSAYGRIESSWEITETGTDYAFLIPANTTATVALNKGAGSQVQDQSGRAVTGQQQGDRLTFTLGAGRYTFRVLLHP